MTKDEKIKSLATAMTVSKRAATDERAEEDFYHFTDTAPKELVDLFLEDSNMNDLEYEIFSAACDIVQDLYEFEHTDTEDEALERISEYASGSASVYTHDRLAYLHAGNQEEISNVAKNIEAVDIAEACAYWYDEQVETAAYRINEWLTA